MIKLTFLYPLAAAINFFSVTGLLIISGLLGKGELAADIGIVQGALIAVFLSLSGNARSLILANSTDDDERNLYYFRLLLMFPAVIAAFILATSIIDIPIYLFVGLTIRKCSEWFSELQLANREKHNDIHFANRYVQINTAGFLLLILTLAFSWVDVFYLVLYVWALLPAIFLFPYIRWIYDAKRFKLSFSKFIPHIGSTSVIGITTYIFRILIVLLAGKALSGQMFTAYALGGIVSALYTYALGPTLLLRGKNSNSPIYFFTLLSILVGGGVCLSVLLLDGELSSLFVYAIGFSLMGGGIMLLAQRKRMYLLQVAKNDVFVPDALINILITLSIPFAYYAVGQVSLTFFFLWAAILNLLFYSTLSFKSRIGNI
tara:strand:- start:14524 stop:15645 length:1122 start_codon:yes stop_codon:yes gene_type:complete